MTETHSKEYWIGYVDEKAFDGGDNGIAYAETEPVRTTTANSNLALVPHNLWMEDGNVYPVKEQQHVATESAGQDVSEKKSINQDTLITPGSKVQYVQNATWLEKALGLATSGYQEVGLKEKKGTTATGLALDTAYQLGVAVDGGANVNYTLAATHATVANTYADLLTLIEAQIGGAGIEAHLYAGDLRFTSDTTGASSDIALQAGGASDMFAALTGWEAADSFNTAVDGKAAQAAGAVPTNSWCEVFDDGQRLKFASGCYITSYTMSGSGTDFPKEEMEYNAVNVKNIVSDANFPNETELNESEIAKRHYNFTIEPRYIDGSTPITDWEGITLNINPEYREKGGGTELHEHPYLLKRNWEVEVSTFQYDSTLYEYLESATPTSFTTTIVGWGKTLTLTNMQMKPDSLNIKEVPSKGMKLYTYTLEIGGSSVASLS